MVGVDDDRHASVVELGLGDHVVGGRHRDDGHRLLAHGAVVGGEELEHLGEETWGGEGAEEACVSGEVAILGLKCFS